jgi:hypothetical protein
MKKNATNRLGLPFGIIVGKPFLSVYLAVFILFVLTSGI